MVDGLCPIHVFISLDLSFISSQNIKITYFYIVFISFLFTHIPLSTFSLSFIQTTIRLKLSSPYPAIDGQPFGHYGPSRHHQSLRSPNGATVLSQLPRKTPFFSPRVNSFPANNRTCSRHAKPTLTSLITMKTPTNCQQCPRAETIA